MGNGGGASRAEGTGGESLLLDGAAVASRIGGAGNNDGFNKGFLQCLVNSRGNEVSMHASGMATTEELPARMDVVDKNIYSLSYHLTTPNWAV